MAFFASFTSGVVRYLHFCAFVLSDHALFF